MAAETVNHTKRNADVERPSGVPGPHELGESRREGLYVAAALLVLLLIGLSFWVEATP